MRKIYALLGIIALPGCASIISGSTQQVNLQPSTSTHGRVNAEVTSKAGTQTVVLPAVITVKRSSQDILVNIKEDDNPCMEESKTVVTSGLNAIFLANIITGGTLGSTTDGATGAMWKYDDVAVVPVSGKQNCKQ